jgi:hypothetical protein
MGTMPSGTSATGPVPTGPVPTGSYATGDVPTGTYPTGQVPNGSYATGPVPNGSYATGPVPNGSYATGPVPTGADATGPVPTGAYATGQVPTGTYATGPVFADSSPARTAPPRQRRKGLVVALIAVVAVLVLGGAGVGIGWAITGGFAAAKDDAAPVVVLPGDDDTEQPEEPEEAREASGTASPPPESSPEPTEEPEEVLAMRQFRSPSGNLRCAIGTFEDEPAAVCQQELTDYPFPDSACRSGATGVVVGVRAEGDPYWPCLPADLKPTEELALDTPFTHGGITCSFSLETGATCLNESGSGFSIEYYNGVTLH